MGRGTEVEVSPMGRLNFKISGNFVQFNFSTNFLWILSKEILKVASKFLPSFLEFYHLAQYWYKFPQIFSKISRNFLKFFTKFSTYFLYIFSNFFSTFSSKFKKSVVVRLCSVLNEKHFLQRLDASNSWVWASPGQAFSIVLTAPPQPGHPSSRMGPRNTCNKESARRNVHAMQLHPLDDRTLECYCTSVQY